MNQNIGQNPYQHFFQKRIQKGKTSEPSDHFPSAQTVNRKEVFDGDREGHQGSIRSASRTNAKVVTLPAQTTSKKNAAHQEFLNSAAPVNKSKKLTYLNSEGETQTLAYHLSQMNLKQRNDGKATNPSGSQAESSLYKESKHAIREQNASHGRDSQSKQLINVSGLQPNLDGSILGQKKAVYSNASTNHSSSQMAIRSQKTLDERGHPNT